MIARIAVVGGGVSGLTAAYRLRTLLPDAAITVFEPARLGGKVRTVDVGGVTADVGAEAFLARRPEAVDLATELGLSLVHPSSARASVRAGGRTVGLPSGTLMGIPASASAVDGVLSADGVAAVDAECSLAPVHLPADGDVSLGRLLRERFGEELVRRLVDPLLSGVYGGGADGLGLRAVLPALAAALDGGAASVSDAVAGLLPPPGSRSSAPVFATVPGGLAVLVGRLFSAAECELVTGDPVRDIRRNGPKWTVQGADFDAVVLAVPAPAAGKLLRPVVPEAADALAGVELASMAVVTMAFDAGVELPDASGCLIAEGERRSDGAPFTAKAFTYSARKWDHLDGVVLRASVGRFGDVTALKATDTELAGRVREDLAELTGIEATPKAVHVQRWGGGLPQYGVGHVARVARIEAAVAAEEGLEIVGAALHGVGIPACIATADAAATRLAEQMG